MKHTKKLVSLLLALVLMLALTVPALAAGHTYEIYQIFTGDYSEGILSNVKWGQNGTGTEGTAVDKEILKELGGVAGSTSGTAQLAVITKYAKLEAAEGEAAVVPFRSGIETTYTGLPNGYYLVKDKDGTQNGENAVYTLYVVKVVDSTLTFSPKGNVPSSEKKILEGSSEVDVNEASIGDEVKYQLTGTLPTNFDDYNTYYYVFTDTLSKGLTFKNDVAVKIDGVDVTKYFHVSATTYSETAGTTITVGIQDIKALSLLSGVTVTKDSKIVVTYTATLNENAVIAGEGNPNDVVLKYSNDPNNSGDGSTTPPENPGKPNPTHPTGDTPKDTVVTYTTELTILKKNDAGNVLPGAEFTLTGEGVNIVLVTTEKFTVAENGGYWKLKDGTYTKTAPDGNNDKYDSITTKYAKTVELVAKGNGETKTDVVGAVDSETGTVTFTGLGAGTYTITETKTPAGYNTIAPITFTLTFNAETKTFASDNTAVVVGEDNKLDTTIVNEKGTLLPETGGMGTTLFYAIGGILVLAAVVLFVTKRRMSAEK